MKAMVLAAGEGRRLRPLTEKTPKALVPVGGIPVLERVLGLLRGAGVSAAVVNTFHLAEQVEKFLRSKDFGLEVETSREKVLLDTGGGLKNAAKFFSGETEPFFLYNADVVSDVDLKELYAAHRGLATLGVSDRPTKRRLIFDAGRLIGRPTGTDERREFRGVARLSGCATEPPPRGAASMRSIRTAPCLCDSVALNPHHDMVFVP